MLKHLMLILLSGLITEECLPSGPGAYHSRPDFVFYKDPTQLEWKFVIRGHLGSGAARRYADEEVFYRVKGEVEYRRAKVRRVSESDKSVTLRATIPPIHATEGDVLEYYLTRTLDGHRVRSPQPGKDANNPIEVPLRHRTQKLE